MKSLIMTGADGALGRVVAKRLLDDGWIIYASAFDDKSVQAFGELFPDSAGKSIHVTKIDLADPEGVKKFVASAVDVEGLVHLAGGYRGGNSISDHSADDFDFLFSLNAKPTFLLLKEIVPVLKKNRSGSIVTVAAKPVLHQAKGNAVYAASKSAVLTMTMSVAEECREFHVRANCILPATLQTPNNLSWANEEQFKKFTPLGDVAGVISFLMSDASRGITGMPIPMYNELSS